MGAKTINADDRKLYDEMVIVCDRMLQASSKAKSARMARIFEFEKDYNNVMRPTLPGRYYYPIPVMGGFVDTLESKIDDPVNITYFHTDEADYKAAKKSTALLKRESSDTHGKWNRKDRGAKKSAAFSGRGIMEYHASSFGAKYKSVLSNIDYKYFHAEPHGGDDLENHLFCGHECIFLTKSQLEDGAKDGTYDSVQVAKLLAHNEGSDRKDVENKYEDYQERLQLLNIKPEDNYVGEQVYNFAQFEYRYKGKRWYMLWDTKTKIWVRCKPLKQVFYSELYSYITWATHPEAYNFWSKSPCDDVWPVSEAIKELVSQTMFNLKKRNEPQRAYDPEIFPNHWELDYIPNGLVTANSKEGEVNIKNGIYTFETPETTNITINMTEWLDSYLGKKTGITPDAQGSSKEKTNGIYYGNMQQVADRMGLYNKNYSEFQTELGIRFYWGAREHLRGKEAVRIMGTQEGSQWEEVMRKDLKTKRELEVSAVSSSAEVAQSENKKKNRLISVQEIVKNPTLVKEVNPKWVVEQLLRAGDFEDDEIHEGMSKDDYGNRELMAEAMEAVEMILEGKEPKRNRGANPAFLQKILDFSLDHEELDDATYAKLIKYVEDHVPIAVDNMARKAILDKKLIAQDQIANPMPGNKPEIPQGVDPTLDPNNPIA